VLTWVSGALAAVIVLSSGVLWALITHYEGRLDRINAFGGLVHRPSAGSGDAVNYLLVGSDSRAGLSKKERHKLTTGGDVGQRSDVMILIHVSKNQEKATLVSFPRDSLVTIPAHKNKSDGKQVPAAPNKLNTAYAFGGPQLLIQTIERATGVRIDHYLEINFAGVVRMTDAVGGVDVCLPAAVNDKDSGLHLPKGKSHVNGVQGLAFVRAREFDPRADLGRIERQQQFLGSMLQEATSKGVLLNPAKLNSFVNAAVDNMRTDDGLSRSDLLLLATKLRSLSPKNVTFVTVPIANPSHPVPGLGSTALWDKATASLLFSRIRQDQPVVGPEKSKIKATVPPGNVKVQVFNAAGTAGLGKSASKDLADIGFNVVADPQNAKRSGGGTTVIRYDPAYSESVKTVHAALPGARLRKVAGLGSTLEVYVDKDYSGAQKVKLAGSGGAGGISSRNGAQNPCR
jgi:LCP family protein required for cell wall assembly